MSALAQNPLLPPCLCCQGWRDLLALGCALRREVDSYVLNGHKWWASGAMDPRCAPDYLRTLSQHARVARCCNRMRALGGP